VLLRSPALFAAFVFGTFLVAVAAASYPLFLSASESEQLQDRIADPIVTPYGMGINYRATEVEFDQPTPDGEGTVLDRRLEAFSEATAPSPHLRGVVEGLGGTTVDLTTADGQQPASGPLQGRLFAGTDVLAHVEVLEGQDGDGVWVPDDVADELGIGPGDEFLVGAGRRREALTVDGVYRALYRLPPQGYWRLWRKDIYAECIDFDCLLPPQFILMDRDQLSEVGTALGRPSATMTLQAPARVEPPLTLGESRELAVFESRLEGQMQKPSTDLGRVFQCCGSVYLDPACTAFFCPSSETSVGENAGLVVRAVDERIAAIQGPMAVLTIAGLGIALAIVAAAAVFVMTSRRVEAGVLDARGWSGTAVGAKAVIEALLASVLGGVAGFVVASAVIGWLGPEGRIAPEARRGAVIVALAGVIIALVFVGIVSALSFRSSHDRRHRTIRVLAYVPWELFALAGAWILAERLRSGGALVDIGDVQRPSAAVFLFPLLLALGGGVLAARAMAGLIAISARRRSDRGGVTAMWLATHRLRASARLPQLLVVAGSLSLAVFISSQALVGSLRTTVDAKAQVFVGSDVQAWIHPDSGASPDFPYPVTKVVRGHDVGSIADSTVRFDMLAIDPATFEGAAYWNGAFSDDDLATLLDRLANTDGALPVVVSGRFDVDANALDLAGTRVPIQTVGRASSFPGTSTDRRPVLVVDVTRLEAAFVDRPFPLVAPIASTELWVDGPTDEVLGSLDQLGAPTLQTLTAREVESIPFIDAAVQTFLILNVLGVVAIVLLVIVAVMYLQARQRSRVVASALSARMGQRPDTMRRASVLELGLVLLGSLIVGAFVGAAAADVVARSLDPLPTIPPAPLVVQPIGAIVAAAIAVGLAAVVGGFLADRSARRVALGEVLRVGG
jgi:hypothetical protein